MTAPILSGEQYWKEYFERAKQQRENAIELAAHHRELCTHMVAFANGGVPLVRVSGEK